MSSVHGPVRVRVQVRVCDGGTHGDVRGGARGAVRAGAGDDVTRTLEAVGATETWAMSSARCHCLVTSVGLRMPVYLPRQAAFSRSA